MNSWWVAPGSEVAASFARTVCSWPGRIRIKRSGWRRKERQKASWWMFPKARPPGEDVGEIEVAARGLGLEEGDLVGDWEADLFVPAGVEVLQEVTRFVYANEKGGEKALVGGKLLYGMAEAVETIDEGAEFFAVAGARFACWRGRSLSARCAGAGRRGRSR